MNDMVRICQTPDMFAKDFWEGHDMTFDKAAFGQAVAARRRALKLSQTSVPGGPSSSYMSQIEHGKMDPISAETLDKLATGLRWNRVLLGRVYYSGESIDELPTGPLEDDEPIVESYADRVLREAEAAQEAFEKAADAVVAAEAELDRCNWLAFRVILIQEKMRDLGIDAITADRLVTTTDVAEVVATHATTIGVEWTRLDMAIIERFDPEYVEGIPDPLVTYQRYMDMTAARKRASLIPLPDEGTDGVVTTIRPIGPTSGGPVELSDPDESMKPAADDVQTDGDEEPGGSDPNV